MQFQRIARRDKKAFLSDQSKEIGDDSFKGGTAQAEDHTGSNNIGKLMEIPLVLFCPGLSVSAAGAPVPIAQNEVRKEQVRAGLRDIPLDFIKKPDEISVGHTGIVAEIIIFLMPVCPVDLLHGGLRSLVPGTAPVLAHQHGVCIQIVPALPIGP